MWRLSTFCLLMVSTSMCGWHKCGRLLCGEFLMTGFHLRPGKESVAGQEVFNISSLASDFKPCSLLLSDSHYGLYTPCPLLWPVAETRCRSRYWDHVQRCRVCPIGSWRSPSNSVCYEARIPPIPDHLVISGDEREIGTQTLPILDPQKFLLSCITTTTETSMALITAWIYGMMMRS